jgi:hypothetical protein
MRTRTLLMLMTTLIVLAGCSAVTVVSDYDSSIPFSVYRTYRWTDGTVNGNNVLDENPLVLKRIKSSVDRELAARGYILENGGPADFSIAVSASVRKRIYYDPPPAGFYYYRGFHGRYGFYHPYWWGGPYATTYEEGTLVIDIIDRKSSQMAWRGIGRGILKRYDNGNELQQDIDEAVTKILAEFPPQPKQ